MSEACHNRYFMLHHNALQGKAPLLRSELTRCQFRSFTDP
jgi:hypothetical protein